MRSLVIAGLLLLSSSEMFAASELGEGRAQLRPGPHGGTVQGTEASEILRGGPAEDFLIGAGGNDVFYPGGPSGAMAIGGMGNDSYVYAKADGRLMIRDTGGDDEIRFGPGIAPADVLVSATEMEVRFLVRGSAQAGANTKPIDQWSVLVVLPSLREAHRIERVVFSEGTVWTEADVRRRADENAKRTP